MAALVTGLLPILRMAVDTTTTTYKCRSLWFGFLGLRLVILFMAQLPFTKLDADFTCNGTKDSICSRDCFNRRFHRPMMAAWNFIYVLVILTVLLMELLTSHLRSVAQKRSSRGVTDVELEAQAVPTDPRGRLVIDLHRDRGTAGLYLVSVGLRILLEAWFVYVLLSWNLPTLNDGTYECSTDICSELHVCVVRAAPEKRMSIYALASISGMVIFFSVLFFMYSIVHYLCSC